MASNDSSTGSTMNMYLNFTFIIVCCFYSFLIFDTTPRHNFVIHNISGDKDFIVYDPEWFCGPFVSNNEISPVRETNLFPSYDSIYARVVFCYLLLFAVYTGLFMLSRNMS